MNYTQSIGNITELKCLLKFIELGYECSIPYGNGAKYDFVADVNGKMLRIQCKSANAIKSQHSDKIDAFSFSTVCSTTNTQKTIRHRYDETQIDYFATVFDERVYLVPVSECSTSKTLRFIPPANNNKNYNKAEDYEIEKIISYSDDLLQSKKDYETRCNATKEKIQSNQKFYCSECGKEITQYSDTGLCSQCYAKSTRKVDRPSREELKTLIRTMSFLQIGKKYEVSDNTIRKWCKAVNLPSSALQIRKYTDIEWENI